ncbi:hypothetical protein [Paenibacillus sp. SI8]|uniref:hypothetical protein n=1 Tax=unclassified Paenibacillus TaxID=185978 RepID=UPI00346553C1
MGIGKMHGESYPESVRESIEETVQKAMKCGSRDLGFALYECKGCKEGNQNQCMYVSPAREDEREREQEKKWGMQAYERRKKQRVKAAG